MFFTIIKTMIISEDGSVISGHKTDIVSRSLVTTPLTTSP